MSKAYEKLKFYQDICEIRRTVNKMAKKFEKSRLRLASQMRDAARSAKQNIREGYKKGSFGEYVHSINISRGSLEELSGDIEDCFEDGLINQDEFQKITKLIKSADYLSLKYLHSIYRLNREGKWKDPTKRNL